MRFPEWLDVYGDRSYRGECRAESAEQMDAFSWLKMHHPDLHRIAVHPKSESKRTWGQVKFDRATGGMNAGASDIIIPASPPFICEMKRADHTKSTWQKGQVDYLEQCKKQGAFVCVALGFEGFKLAFSEYLKLTGKEK